MIECIIYLLIPRLLCWFIECSMDMLFLSRVIFISIDFLAYMTNWFVDWIINWVIDWLNLLEINFQIFWLIDCLATLLIDFIMAELIDYWLIP